MDSGDLCQIQCFLQYDCKSYNLGPPSEQGKRVCELSSSLHVFHANHLAFRPGFTYHPSTVSRKAFCMYANSRGITYLRKISCVFLRLLLQWFSIIVCYYLQPLLYSVLPYGVLRCLAVSCHVMSSCCGIMCRTCHVVSCHAISFRVSLSLREVSCSAASCIVLFLCHDVLCRAVCCCVM